MSVENQKVDLILESKTPTLGEQFKPVDLGQSSNLTQQWIDAYTRFILIRPNLLGSVVDCCLWVNLTGLAIHLVPIMPWLLIPLAIMILGLSIGVTYLTGMPRVLSVVRLIMLVATCIMVIS